MARSYSREDVKTHYGADRPAVNVKVHRGIEYAWQAFSEQENHDPRFTLEWIREHVSDETADAIFWMTCEYEFEALASYAADDPDAIFADYGVTVEQDGRSGGWAVVVGLPPIDEWDAVLLAKWRKFERIARATADDVPYQMLCALLCNEFELWADEQADEAQANSEAPVDLALAGALDKTAK
jgi:hypothetical protein